MAGVQTAWEFDPTRVSSETWLFLGEMHSKSDHIARIPLGPLFGEAADRAGVLRGALATLRLAGVRSLPRSVPWAAGARWSPPPPATIRPEVEVIVDASAALASRQIEVLPTVTPDAIVALHTRIGGPAPTRPKSALQSVCAWLNGPSFMADVEEMIFPLAVMRACCAHLAMIDEASFPWMNGCTARLLELGFFLQSGVLPVRSAGLGAEHYAQTARRYLREVGAAVAARRPERFIDYAISGIAHGMRRQLDVELQPLWMRRQWAATWETFARARLRSGGVEGDEGDRCLALLLSLGEEIVDADTVFTTARRSNIYRDLDEATAGSDLETLVEMGLVRSDVRLYQADLDAIRVWPVPR
jgi:hypothetical protein